MGETPTQNMNLSSGDKCMLGEYTRRLLMRRGQLHPWTLDNEETERLYIRGDIWRAVQSIREAGYGDVIQRNARITILERTTGGYLNVVVSHDANGGLMSPKAYSAMDVIPGTPEHKKFSEWLAGAAKCKAEDEIVQRLIDTLAGQCTTYRQLEKALPASIQAVAAYAASKEAYVYQYRRNREKLIGVVTALGDSGGKRAKNLPAHLQQLLGKHSALAERVLATCVMLPEDGGSSRARIVSALT